MDRRSHRVHRRGGGSPDPVAVRRGTSGPSVRGKPRPSSSRQVGPEAVFNSPLLEPRRTPSSDRPLGRAPDHGASRSRLRDGAANGLSAFFSDARPRYRGDSGPSGDLRCDSPSSRRSRFRTIESRDSDAPMSRHKRGKHFCVNSRTTLEKARSSTFSPALSVGVARSGDSSSGSSGRRDRQGAVPRERTLRPVSLGAVTASQVGLANDGWDDRIRWRMSRRRSREYVYPEWDVHHRRYRPQWCTVVELEAERADEIPCSITGHKVAATRSGPPRNGAGATSSPTARRGSRP